MRWCVAGGAGFIGCNFVRHLLRARGDQVVVADKLTYAGDRRRLPDGVPLEVLDLADADAVEALVAGGRFDVVINFAAETHVDNAIRDPLPFSRANLLGAHVLLDACRRHGVPRYHQVSTDEVYGAILEGAFAEDAPALPTNPYSASKAAADLMVRAYAHTYGAPRVTVSRCTNNYGPHQHAEKMIPNAIRRALADLPIPLYGDGLHRRDWLFVEDHCRALARIVADGRAGEVYHVASGSQVTNADLLGRICDALGKPRSLIEPVADRPGHDRRYALATDKIERELGWRPEVSLDEGLGRTIAWHRRKDERGRD